MSFPIRRRSSDRRRRRASSSIAAGAPAASRRFQPAARCSRISWRPAPTTRSAAPSTLAASPPGASSTRRRAPASRIRGRPHANLPLPVLRSARRNRIPLCRRTEGAARAGRLDQRRRMGRLPLVQRQSERRRARDLAPSHLHGDVRHDARHGAQRDVKRRHGGERGAVSGLRLPSGGGVDRGRPCVFTFDGKPYAGFEGDSIASALLANGVGVVGRSFKYHRPRGIWGAWTEEPNAIVDVTHSGRTTPNLRATTEALENDVAVRSVNATPAAAYDRAALIDQFSAFMPSGFYYKTFLWPRWETFEPAV